MPKSTDIVETLIGSKAAGQVIEFTWSKRKAFGRLTPVKISIDGIWLVDWKSTGGGGKLLARPRNNHSAHSTYIPKKRASVPSRSLRGKRRKTLRPGSVVLAWDFPLLRQWFTISRAHSGTSAAEPTNFAESATRRFLRYDDERIWAAMFCFFFFAKVDVALTERGSGL